MKVFNNNHGKTSLVTILVDAMVVISVVIGFIIYKTQDKGLKTYIGIDGCFMGCYENGNWYNAQKISDKFFETEHKEFILDDIKQYPVFYYHSYGNEPIEYSDYIENPGTMDDTFRFKKPAQVEQIDNKEKIEIYTNNKQQVFTVENDNIVISNDYDSVINEVKEQCGVSNVNTELSKCISVDYDKDGKNEKILIVNTKSNEDGYIQSQEGVCTFVISLDDDKTYKVIYGFVITKDNIKNMQGVEDQIRITSAVVCDLNNDENFELCINAYNWDVPVKFVYELEKEFKKEFKLKLVGTFPW